MSAQPSRMRSLFARLVPAWPHAALAALVVLFFADPLFTRHVFFLRDVGTAVHPVLAEARALPGGGVDPLPFWTNHLSNGKPLLANPGYALLHPFNVLYLALPFDLAFNLFIVLHVVVAAVGMALLARSQGASRVAAFGAGAAYAFGGYIISTTNLYPTLASAAWAPLVLLCGLRAAAAPDARRLALLALTVAVQALGGQPEPVLLTLALGGAWSLLRAPGSPVRRVARVGWTWGVAGAWALLLAAPQVLPSGMLAQQTLRSMGFTVKALLYNSLHPGRLPGLVLPRFGGHPADRLAGSMGWGEMVDAGTPYFLSIYSGVTVVLLACAGLVLARRVRRPAVDAPDEGIRRARWLLAAAAVAGCVLALGRFLPGMETLASALPGIVPFRYPEKLVFWAALVLPLLAALGLDEVARRSRGSLRALPVFLAALLAADLVLTHRGYAPTAPSPKKPALARLLVKAARENGVEDAQWRVYRHRTRRSWRPPASLREGTEQALYGWQRSVLRPATGVRFGVRYAFERAGDQLDLLPYFTLAHELHEKKLPERARALGSAGVLWFVSQDSRLAKKSEQVLVRVRQLDHVPGLEPSGWLYRNTAFVPRARLEGATGSASIASEDHRSLVVSVMADAPGQLVVSDALAPGWSVSVDGALTRILRVDGVFRAVDVPTGSHEVRFEYVPPGLRAGVALALVGLVALAWAMLPRPRA